MIQRLSDSPCIERAPSALGRLSIRFIIKVFWRPSVNVCDKGDRTCGRMPHGSIRTTWSIISRKTKFQWWNITMRFLLYRKVKSALKGTSSSPEMQWKQKLCSPDTQFAFNTGHSQTTCRAWLKLCLMIEVSPHVHVEWDKSSLVLLFVPYCAVVEFWKKASMCLGHSIPPLPSFPSI